MEVMSKLPEPWKLTNSSADFEEKRIHPKREEIRNKSNCIYGLPHVNWKLIKHEGVKFWLGPALSDGPLLLSKNIRFSV
jgi:hypothetical protein